MTALERHARDAAIMHLWECGFDETTIANAMCLAVWVVRRVIEREEKDGLPDDDQRRAK